MISFYFLFLINLLWCCFCTLDVLLIEFCMGAGVTICQKVSQFMNSEKEEKSALVKRGNIQTKNLKIKGDFTVNPGTL